MFALLGILFCVTWVGCALYGVWATFKHDKGGRRALGMLGGLLVAYGGFGFISAGIGSSMKLPSSLEWPIGWANQTLTLADGRIVATHTPSGRIQVYDRNWQFITGWNVEASGGKFHARLLPEDRIAVWTARRQRKFVFTPEGECLEATPYAPEQRYNLNAPDKTGFVPTAWWLLVFAHPFVGWGVAVIGGLLLGGPAGWSSWRQRHSTRGAAGTVSR
jgi:hypothetical protein